MISYLCILLLLPFGGFGEDEIVDETTQTPNDVMTTAQEHILSNWKILNLRCKKSEYHFISHTNYLGESPPPTLLNKILDKADTKLR